MRRHCARVHRFDWSSIAFKCSSDDKQHHKCWRRQRRRHWRDARGDVVVIQCDAQRRRQIASQRAHSRVCAATVCCQRVRRYHRLCDSVSNGRMFSMQTSKQLKRLFHSLSQVAPEYMLVVLLIAAGQHLKNVYYCRVASLVVGQVTLARTSNVLK